MEGPPEASVSAGFAPADDREEDRRCVETASQQFLCCDDGLFFLVERDEADRESIARCRRVDERIEQFDNRAELPLPLVDLSAAVELHGRRNSTQPGYVHTLRPRQRAAVAKCEITISTAPVPTECDRTAGSTESLVQ